MLYFSEKRILLEASRTSVTVLSASKHFESFSTVLRRWAPASETQLLVF